MRFEKNCSALSFGEGRGEAFQWNIFLSTKSWRVFGDEENDSTQMIKHKEPADRQGWY
jgi:hypothetical protein